MAKLIKCPRCQAKIDVTDLSAGSTVRCTDCGAMVRIPSGNTGKHAAVPPPPAPAPAPAPAAAQASGKGGTKKRTAGRQTNLFRKMSNVKAPGESRPRGGSDRGAAGPQKSNTNMIVAACVGGVLLLGALAFALMGGKDTKHPAKSSETADSGDRKKKKSSSSDYKPSSSDKSSSGSMSSSSSSSSGPSVAPGQFQPGARGKVDPTLPNLNTLVTDSTMKQDVESMLSGGKSVDLIAQDHRYLLYIFDAMLSDNEAVARAAMAAVHDIIVKRSLASDVQQYTQLAKNANIQGFEMAAARTEEYAFWSRWWFQRTSQDAVAKWATDAGAPFNPSGSSPAKSVSAPAGAGEWDQIMTGLRSGGGFDNQNSPEYSYFMHVKSMGKSAYPNIIKYIDHEDPAMGKAAVALLSALTGRAEERRLNDGNKAAIKADWEAWLKTQ